MRPQRTAFVLLALFAAALACESAFARGGRGGGGHFGGAMSFHGSGFHGGFQGRPVYHRGGGARVGVFVGAPLFWPWYDPWPRYYYPYPSAAYVPPAPPVYIEQATEEPAPDEGSAYWHYCASPKGYYPYVQECPGGWQQVPAQPSSQAPGQPGYEPPSQPAE